MTTWLSSHPDHPQARGPAGGAAHQPFTDPANAEGVIARLRRIAEETPSAPVAIDGTGRLTFVQLWNAAIALASDIDRRDPGGGPVGILLNADRHYLVALMACIAAQRVAVLLDASFPDARNLSMMANAGVSLVLRHDETPLAPAGGDRPIEFDRPVDLDQPAFVLATSGSSGSPKLIAHSQRTLWHWARTAHDSMRVSPGDRALSVSSPSSLGGITALFGFPLAGASVHLLDIKTSGITGLLRCLAHEPITILRGAPSFFRTLASLESTREAFAKLRIIHLYGEPLLRADLRALRNVLPHDCLVRTSYGSTECSGLNWFADPAHEHDEFRVAAGVLMPDTEAMIDDEGRRCGPDEAGELVIRSAYNALGEWQNGTLVPGRLIPDPLHPTYRIYRTGDLARYTEHQVFVILGRQDRMVKINGQRVEPAEIETLLRASPNVADFEIVSSLRDGRTVLIAYVVAKPGSSSVVESTRRSLHAALPAFMVPRIVLVDQLPRLPGGKVDVTALRALGETR